MNYTGAGIVVAVVDEGLNTNHPELRENYDKKASKDFVDGDSHPEPRSSYVMSGHGSKCAGIIAAKGNNGFCGVGLAYNARIGGKNRSIFVFAAGNGGILAKDSCAYNGYVNSIYTIAISSVNRDGSVPYYGERCPGIMAVAYSRDSFGDKNPVVIGAAAKKLTWRDVQHIIVRSSRFAGRNPPDMVENGAGLKVSNYLGFGLMDALQMVNFARKWKNVPKQMHCEVQKYLGSYVKYVSFWPLTSKIEILHNSCKERIGFLEHVLVRVNLQIWPRGDLLLSLKSPNGTVSRLTQHRPFDRFKSVSTNLTNWNILTLHHWGEDPRGTWTLKAGGDYEWLYFQDWTLILYGTTSDPLLGNYHLRTTRQKPDGKQGEIVVTCTLFIITGYTFLASAHSSDIRSSGFRKRGNILLWHVESWRRVFHTEESENASDTRVTDDEAQRTMGKRKM
ncbi:unnamed protein product [Porites lobata]|uniref:P/Homo B domain-containing protein n=1 Tax=Porites lobata TaxID=104759 RepID=A0ABN8QSC8_9CNID|nr:unnamed protein product [Porites lobata]